MVAKTPEARFESSEDRARKEEWLEQHAFDRWKQDSNAMARIKELLALGRRIKSGEIDETFGGRPPTVEDFDRRTEQILNDFSMADILLAQHPETGKNTIAIIRWMVGLVEKSPFIHEN